MENRGNSDISELPCASGGTAGRSARDYLPRRRVLVNTMITRHFLNLCCSFCFGFNEDDEQPECIFVPVGGRRCWHLAGGRLWMKADERRKEEAVACRGDHVNAQLNAKTGPCG